MENCMNLISTGASAWAPLGVRELSPMTQDHGTRLPFAGYVAQAARGRGTRQGIRGLFVCPPSLPGLFVLPLQYEGSSIASTTARSATAAVAPTAAPAATQQDPAQV